MLDGPVAPETSPDCRAELGDRDCRVDMAARRLLVRVTAVDGDVIAIEAGLAEGLYAFGRLRWLEGRNAGLTQIDRKSVVKGQSVSVRVDLGGRRIIKNKSTQQRNITLSTRS